MSDLHDLITKAPSGSKMPSIIIISLELLQALQFLPTLRLLGSPTDNTLPDSPQSHSVHSSPLQA